MLLDTDWPDQVCNRFNASPAGNSAVAMTETSPSRIRLSHHVVELDDGRRIGLSVSGRRCSSAIRWAGE
ncbi:hypothetical protein [Mycobacterium senriense]|uniref:hypothetical protein n=1 Tax=Mycobacterium senriense TaxID=2775496 RepID=UPI001C80FD33|nr:hypothetical protein [Mycobacterium senriense]